MRNEIHWIRSLEWRAQQPTLMRKRHFLWWIAATKCMHKMLDVIVIAHSLSIKTCLLVLYQWFWSSGTVLMKTLKINTQTADAAIAWLDSPSGALSVHYTLGTTSKCHDHFENNNALRKLYALKECIYFIPNPLCANNVLKRHYVDFSAFIDLNVKSVLSNN